MERGTRGLGQEMKGDSQRGVRQSEKEEEAEDEEGICWFKCFQG